MAKKVKKNKSKSTPDKSVNDDGVEHANQKVIADPRFAGANSDPRFQTPPKKQTKVIIDSRFTPVLTDRRFASKLSLDKRGKKQKKQMEVNADLKHYYQKSGESESEYLEEKEEEERAIESSTDDDDVTLVFEDDVAEIEVEEEDVPVAKEDTRRLAVVNIDWRHVRAVDLYVLVSSFLPRGGYILSVSVYPTEFGLQRMEEEEVRGHVRLFDDEEDSGGSDDGGDDENDIDKVRDYEKSRLRYYYAVVECDSVSTANHIYKDCDRFGLDQSPFSLDLRFIPDSMEFKHPPRDVATEAPAQYEGLYFNSKGLQHTNIDISWDEDDPNRIKTIRRHFNHAQLAESDSDTKEFLADDSDTDDSAEDKSEKKESKLEKRRNKYLPLCQSGDGSDGDDEDEPQDMEVTFYPGLEDVSKHILEKKKNKESKSVWDENQRKRREKKKSRDRKSQDSSDDYRSNGYAGKEEEAEDFFVDEPSLEKVTKIDARRKGGKKGKSSADIDEEAKATTAELELLVADNDNNTRGYNLKPKKTKGEKGKEIADGEKIPSVDLNDQRYSKVFSSPLFALDPTDPQFKRSAAYVRQMSKKQRKEDPKRSPEEEPPPHRPTRGGLLSGHPDVEVHHPKDSDVVLSRREKHELSSMVKSIKRNSQRVQLSSEDRLSKKQKAMLPRTPEKIESRDPSYAQTRRQTNIEKKNKKKKRPKSRPHQG